jgi:hypothetical protein
MKKRKEGTFRQIEAAGDDPDYESAIAQIQDLSFCGLADFVAKARDLSDRVDAAPYRIRAQRAASLRHDLDAIERALKLGVDEAALYDAIGAALTFANLSYAERDDADSYDDKDAIKMGDFLAAENRVLKKNAQRGVTRKPDPKEITDEMQRKYRRSIDRFMSRNISEE